MKKILVIFSLIGLFTFLSPNLTTKVIAAESDPCPTVTIICEDGTAHYAIVCSHEDLIAWFDILCGEITG